MERLALPLFDAPVGHILGEDESDLASILFAYRS
jgi:hypothetical protein